MIKDTLKLSTLPKFEVYKEDLKRWDWWHADFVIANSTCFDSDLMQEIAVLAEKMKAGSWLITLTKSIT